YDALNGGIGFIATADEAGVGTLRTFSVSGMYAYQIILSKYITMRAGIQAGVFQKTIDFGKLQFYDQIVRTQGFVNPTQEPPIANAVLYPNFSAGTIIYSNQFYAGFSVHNLNEPKQGFYANDQNSKVPMRFTAH